jgi:hypothetical protein
MNPYENPDLSSNAEVLNCGLFRGFKSRVGCNMVMGPVPLEQFAGPGSFPENGFQEAPNLGVLRGDMVEGGYQEEIPGEKFWSLVHVW